MPYELSFTKPLMAPDESIYINDCCWGGDAVRDELLPAISGKFEDVWTNQEDWGWFIWFKRGRVRLAVDIFCDEPRAGKFRIRLSSQLRRIWFRDRVLDTPELEEVLELVRSRLERWAGAVKVERVE